MLAAESKAISPFEGVSPEAGSPFAWKQIVEPVDPFLVAVAQRLAEQVKAFDPDIVRYAEYALSNQGKQLRPVLVGLSGGCLGRAQDAHVTVAVIIEMIHLATLVHDDVIDEAQIRRGRPTMAANWGNDISVLLGDCLFAHALQLASGFPTTEICRAVSAATNTVCAGEILQTLKRRNFNFSQAEYFKILAMKTGELFALSCDLGAYLSDATPVQRQALRQYGMDLGTAYQVYDDCVDIFGSELRAGKSLGTDLAKGKLTLPVLLLLERADAACQIKVRDLFSRWQPEHLPEMLGLLKRHDTLNGSRAVIHKYLVSARERLQALPASESRIGLEGLADFLARQTDKLGGQA